MELTHKKLTKTLDYINGVFYWKIDGNNQFVKKGRIAGSVEKKGYLVLTIFGKRYKAHRLAWFYEHGHFPSNQIDHINQNKLDNRIENLRDVDNRTNATNRPIRTPTKSGCYGVTWNKYHQKWAVRINIDKPEKHIGYFKALEDAIAKRKSLEVNYGYSDNHSRLI